MQRTFSNGELNQQYHRSPPEELNQSKFIKMDFLGRRLAICLLERLVSWVFIISWLVRLLLVLVVLLGLELFAKDYWLQCIPKRLPW